MKANKSKSFLFRLASVAILISIWWIASATVFKQNGVIPSPPKTLQIIGSEMQKAGFFTAIANTVTMSILSFVISFAMAFLLAVLSHLKSFVRNLVSPYVSLCRCMPTMALVLILLMVVPSGALSIAVAFLVVFPVCYENLFTAINQTDKKLLDMARVFKVSKLRQIFGIYLPSMLPYIFSSIIAGFGLNLKVVISSEVIGLPTMSIGYQILSNNQGFNFGGAFAWLIIAVILSFLFEIVLKMVARLFMPYKYPDRKILKQFFGKIANKFTKKSTGN